MDLRISGKRALVSGSTAGIGFAIAAALAEEGAHVIVNGRTAARVDAAVQAIRGKLPHAELRGVAADLGTAAGCQEILGAVPEVDILVNNLGIADLKPFTEISDADWTRLLEVNL